MTTTRAPRYSQDGKRKLVPASDGGWVGFSLEAASWSMIRLFLHSEEAQANDWLQSTADPRKQTTAHQS